MSQLLRKLLSVYMAENDGEGGDGGGGADQVAADKAEADRVSAEAADKDVADAKTTTDKPKVTDAEAKLLKEVMDKKNALKKTNDELAALKSKITALEEFGGVEALKALAVQKKEMEAKKLEEQGEWSRLKQQMNDEHGKILTEKLSLLEASNAENKKLQDQIAELTVGAAFSGSKFVKESLTMPTGKVRALYGSHFEFKDGAVVGFDKPAGATERTMLVDAQGDPLNFELAMTKLIEIDPDRDSLIKSKSKPGAGSSTSRKTTEGVDLEKLRGTSRISAGLAAGQLNKK